jgi:hypothetical protein
MTLDEERLAIFEVAEAGALIQRHMGNGGVYEAIEAAEGFLEAHTEAVDEAELPDPEDTAAWENTTRAAFLVGFGEGVSRKAFQDNEPAIMAQVSTLPPPPRASWMHLDRIIA